jgi:hypothetical protein
MAQDESLFQMSSLAHNRRMTIWLLSLALGSTLSADSGQSRGGGTPASACQVLSGSEIRKLTGRQDYDDGDQGDAPGEGIGGGSSCQFTGAKLTDHPPGIGIVLIPLKGGASRTGPGAKPSPGCTVEPVAGVGDAATFEVCERGNPRITVRAGAHDLIVLVQAATPAASIAIKSTMVEIAKAAAAKLR